VTTFDNEPVPTAIRNAAPISQREADTRRHEHELRRKQLRAPPAESVHEPDDRVPRQFSRAGFAGWQSRRLAAYVDANLTGRVVIKDLAAALHMSVGHFSRTFKRTFAMPARIWIRHRRIELAQGLMLTTCAPLSEIALSCGMCDQSHFTRSFRRIVGETPFSWRRARRGALEERVTELADPTVPAHSPLPAGAQTASSRTL
jgi:AraC-like DNA-binding protein